MQSTPNMPTADCQHDILLHIADEIDIPTSIMDLLITEGYLENYYDFTTLSTSSLLKFSADHKFLWQCETDWPPRNGFTDTYWTHDIPAKLWYLHKWIHFFLKRYACLPQPEEMIHEDLEIFPERLMQEHHLQRFTMASTYKHGEIQWRPIFELFPKFSGQPQDWCNFEKQFKSVATSQGFAYIFQEHECVPMTPFQKLKYCKDLAFIYEAFYHCWDKPENFAIFKWNGHTRNGRQLYFDAICFFWQKN